ncbi:hypothetical protein [Cryobacterium sp. TmT2-59]|uniref:hypothetical protein n=1 Tax=Cryobacterium sp. TmT2-59 TaxID=1259264 RepID=UPI0015805C01|nr:hypothetical protein [Cryobacterium sp. TmT2-59]
MRTVTRALLTLSALVLLGGPALAGCAPTPTPKPSATATTDAPVFASDADALAAATEAYAAYQAMSTQIAHEGGAYPERMENFATGEALDAEIRSLNGIAQGGLRGVGALSFDSLTIQEADLTSGKVATYLCLDIQGSDVVDASGASKAPQDRVLRLPLQVDFVHDPARTRLLVEKSESWSGTSFC